MTLLWFSLGGAAVAIYFLTDWYGRAWAWLKDKVATWWKGDVQS